jgi:hypothetical protein
MHLRTIIAGAVSCMLACTAPALAQFEISWYTMDAGGGVASGGGFTLNGTIAQSADVGEANFGGPMHLAGGYWSPGVITPACPIDFNRDGVVSVQDIFDFLTAWNNGDAVSDFNQENGITVQDIYDFLFAWTLGC